MVKLKHNLRKKYNYPGSNRAIAKADILKGRNWCFSDGYDYYVVYTFYILNVIYMETINIYKNWSCNLL